MKIGVVIARYNENVEWTKEINHKIYLYNKGEEEITNSIKLVNVGREAHTYLFHIVKNYDNLDDVTVFLQGDPQPHGFFCNFESFQHFNNFAFKKSFMPFLRKTENYNFLECDMLGGPWMNVDMLKFAKEHDFEKHLTGLNKLEFVQGAQFAVHKDLIRSNSYSVYQKLLNTLSKPENDIHAHTLERLWKHLLVR